MAEAIQLLTRQGHPHTAVLLADEDDPHSELLTLFWGPQCDRAYALALWVRFSKRQPREAVPLLPELLSLADRFDALNRTEQQWLRRLILRHRERRSAVH